MSFNLVKEKENSMEPAPTKIFHYIYLFIIIIYSGNANTFVGSIYTWENPIGLIIPIVFSGMIILKERVKFSKKFYIIMLIFILYFVANTIKYKEIHPRFFLIYSFSIFLTYVTVDSLKLGFFSLYEKILYHLAVIGLFFWIIQVLLGGDVFYNAIGGLSTQSEFTNVSFDGLNIILYSVQHSSNSLIYSSILPRNCGYAWEPGAFAIFLCLAIFINLFISEKDKSRNKRFWILFIALLSTQSTTGYVIVILIYIFYFYNKTLRSIFIFFPLLIVSVVFLFSLPFMGEKIYDLFAQMNQTNIIIEQSIGSEYTYNPQRFASFMISFKDFLENPFLGYGGHIEDRWFNKIGANIAPIGGIGGMLAQFGSLVFIIILVVSFKTSKYLSKRFCYKGSYLFFYILFLVSISYGIILFPIIMSFWMFPLMLSYNKK